MSEPTLRDFRYPQDYARVLELWQHSGDGIHVGQSDTPAEIEKKLARDPDLFLVAEAEGSIIGTVLGGYDGRRGMMYHLAVAEPYRRQGIASALVAELERRLKARGCIRYYLLVMPDNATAIRYYEDHGWERMRPVAYAKDID